jgi:hypothetical protein
MKKKIFRLVENNTFKINESTHTYDTKLKLTDPVTGNKQDVDVTVEYEYTPSERGERERGSGLQLTPDYSEDIEIISVTDSNGKEYELSDREMDMLVQKILDDVDDSDDGGFDDYADYYNR